MREENNRLQEALLAAKRLEKLAPLQEHRAAAVPANVFARDASSWFKTILVDKGEIDGVSRDMAVAVAEGLVGRVIEVFPSAAKVLLITDPNSGVDVIVQRTRAQGIMEGRVEEFCTLKYVRKMDDVQVGDKVITSGLGGIFPKGLLAGTVTRVEKKRTGLGPPLIGVSEQGWEQALSPRRTDLASGFATCPRAVRVGPTGWVSSPNASAFCARLAH